MENFEQKVIIKLNNEQQIPINFDKNKLNSMTKIPEKLRIEDKILGEFNPDISKYNYKKCQNIPIENVSQNNNKSLRKSKISNNFNQVKYSLSKI